MRFINDLPEPGSNLRNVEARAVMDQARTRPGEWVELPVKVKQPTVTAWQIKNKNLYGAKPGEFDAAVRNGRLYVSCKE